MLNFPSEDIFIATKHVDMRRAFDSLALYIKDTLEKEPLTGKWFVFFNKNHDRVKIFYWDRNGPCIWYKRLEEGVFRPPRIIDKIYIVNSHELNLLLEGIDLTNKHRLGIVPVTTVN
jgi:transposase